MCYDLPVGRGKMFGSHMNRIEDAVAGGWQISGITTAQSGFPMSINPDGNQSVFGGGQHANLTGASFKTGACGGFQKVPFTPCGKANTASSRQPATDQGNGQGPFAGTVRLQLRQWSSLLFKSKSTEIRGRRSDLGKMVQLSRRNCACSSLSRCSTLSTIRISAYPAPESGAPTWARAQAPREQGKCRVY